MSDARVSEILRSMPAIASEYLSAPLLESAEVRDRWRAAAVIYQTSAYRIRRTLNVVETDESDPYPDARSMREDIARGRFLVSRANSVHPVWTVDENVAYRIRHDVIGHALAAASFSAAGEAIAYLTAAADLPPAMRMVEFVETVGQTAAYGRLGGFGAQKCYVPRACPGALWFPYRGLSAAAYGFAVAAS